MNQTLRQVKDGLFYQNPLLVLLLGLSPALALSTSLRKALALAFVTSLVLFFSMLAASLLKNLLSPPITFISHALLVAGFAGILEFFLRWYAPNLSLEMGIFLPLTAVNSIIFAKLSRVENQNIASSIVEGLGASIGFSGAILLLAALRELLSGGTLFEVQIFPEGIPVIEIVAHPVGGFLILGLLCAALKTIGRSRKRRRVL